MRGDRDSRLLGVCSKHHSPPCALSTTNLQAKNAINNMRLSMLCAGPNLSALCCLSRVGKNSHHLKALCSVTPSMPGSSVCNYLTNKEPPRKAVEASLSQVSQVLQKRAMPHLNKTQTRSERGRGAASPEKTAHGTELSAFLGQHFYRSHSRGGDRAAR